MPSWQDAPIVDAPASASLSPEQRAAILARYSPAELAAYRNRGMFDSRGIPTLPPGTPINSQGLPYAADMQAMSPQERAHAKAAEKALKEGTFWAPSAGDVTSAPRGAAAPAPDADISATAGETPKPSRNTSVPAEADALYQRVRQAEGTAAGDGFVLYGGQPFKPGKEFPEWEGAPGPKGPTHAAGPGQWQPGTWNGLKPDFAKRFGRDPDFSSTDDQRAMVWLNAAKIYPGGEAKMQQDIAAGKLNTAALAPQWAGFGGGGGSGWSDAPVTQSGKWRVSDRALATEQSRKNTSVVWMSPDDYLAMTPEIDAGDARPKRRSLMKSLDAGDEIESIPSLEATADKGRLKFTDQDGRNRALAAKAEGVDQIPVAIHGVTGELPGWAEDMRGAVRRFDHAPVPKMSRTDAAKAITGVDLSRAPTERLLGGVLGGFTEAVGGALQGTGQLLSHVLPEGAKPATDALKDVGGFIADRGAPLIEDQKTGAGHFTGEMLGGAVLGGPIGGGANMAAQIGRGALAGAVTSGLQPVAEGPNFWADKAKQTAVGGAVGGAVPAVGNAIGQIVGPAFRPAASRLMNEAVRLTPGQMAGGGFRRVEDAMSSIPVFGQAIRSGMRRSIEDFNRAAWNRVLAPLGKELPRNVMPGRDAAQHVSDAIDDAYASVVPHLQGQADRPFLADLLNIATRASSELPQAQRTRFGEIIRSQLLDKVSAPARGDQLKGIESQLGMEARGYRSDPSWDNRKLGGLVEEVQGAFRAALTRQNPQHAPLLRAANEAYANFVRVMKAASSSGAKEGVFSPAQLRMAVRSSDPSIRKLDFGRGEALMQDLSDAAEAVLPRAVPDSGTPERLLAERALAFLAGGGAAMYEPAALAGGLAAAAPYTSLGMSALHSWATALPNVRNALSGGIRRSANALAPGAGLLAGRAVANP